MRICQTQGITDHWEETAAGPGQHSPSLKYRSDKRLTTF